MLLKTSLSLPHFGSGLSILVLLLFVSSSVHPNDAAPTSQQQAVASPEALHTIIVELENVLYKLKDYARLVHAASGASRTESVGGVVDSDERQLVASRPQQQVQQPQQQQLLPQQLPAASAADKTNQVQSSQQQTSIDSNDISLKEALEYLVSLAKQKKLERRDHDIPFPLTDENDRRYSDRESEK